LYGGPHCLHTALPDDLRQIGLVAPVHLFFGKMLEDKMYVAGVVPAEKNFIAGVHDMYYGIFPQHGNPPRP
jgi:hypothetical protein